MAVYAVRRLLAGRGKNPLQHIRQPGEKTNFAITGVMVLFRVSVTRAIGLYHDFIQTNIHANLRGSRMSLKVTGLRRAYRPCTEIPAPREFFVTNRG